MNIAIWHKRDAGLEKILNEEGVKMRLMSQAMLILPPWKGNDFLMPEILADIEKTDIMISATEIGSGHKKNGKARVICTLGGRPLAAFTVGDRFSTGYTGIAATFMAPFGLVSVETKRRSNNVSLTRHLIVEEGNLIKVVNEAIADELRLEIEWQCLRCPDIPGDLAKHFEPGTNTICLAGMKIKKLGLPAKLEPFREAIEAGLIKVNCYHCRHVHYSKN